MRDWAKTLRRASYRGVPFWVDYDDFNGGKRLARHEYAGGRVTLIEEMGLATADIEVTAYLVGDASDLESTVLGAALLAPGPGMLVLPISPAQLATAESFRRSQEKDRRGYIAMSIRFVPHGNTPIPGIGISDVLAAVSNNLPGAISGLSRLF